MPKQGAYCNLSTMVNTHPFVSAGSTKKAVPIANIAIEELDG